MKIVTFNLRVDSPLDKENRFRNRKGLILEKIDTEKPDVIGFQEMTPPMREFLKKHLTDYTFVGRSRSGDFTGEHMDIAFLKDKYDLFGLDSFWLSPTPYIPDSRYEVQSEYPRITTVAVLCRIEDKKIFRVLNTHLDHEGDPARVLGINQILSYIKEQNAKIELPFFLMGDFNARPESETIMACNNAKDPELCELTAGIEGVTFHNYGNVSENFKIDYIFCDKKTAENNYTVEKWEDNSFGLWLSDHYPLCCDIDF